MTNQNSKPKKSFILFQEYKENLSLLSQSDKGDLLDAIFDFNEGVEKPLSPLVQMAFSFIKSDLNRNQENWQKTKEERSFSGRLGNLKRWNNDLFMLVSAKKISLEEAEIKVLHRKSSLCDNSESQKSQAVANIAVNVNENVNVNVNVNENVKDKKKNISKEISKKPIFELPDFIDAGIWNNFVQHRIKKKAPLNENSIRINLKRLEKWEGEVIGSANQALEDCIASDYRGIFQPKINNQTNKFINSRIKF